MTPTSPDYTPASPDYSLTSDMEFDPSKDPSSDHIPPLPATSPFLSLMILQTRSPTSSSALQRRVMVLAPGQPIPHSRPYHYHLNGLVHMMTARKRVGPMPTHRLDVRHSVDYSSLDHFSLDDSSSDSSSSSSLETSSVSSADVLSDSESSRSSSDHSLPASPSTLSYTRADLLPSPKRIRSPESATDLEDCSEHSFEPYIPREVELGVDFEDESSEQSSSRGADLEMDVDVVRSDGILRI
ncbi:hypothetical protein Tco_0681411 [Tanacetum coccineum]|uniref:Uncharacterized protein n=1 Tax=Tanacetum coccineum TaxID=301880 RepID=A0ABQ4XP71_9ASTR